jgi:hypothetical protein
LVPSTGSRSGPRSGVGTATPPWPAGRGASDPARSPPTVACPVPLLPLSPPWVQSALCNTGGPPPICRLTLQWGPRGPKAECQLAAAVNPHRPSSKPTEPAPPRARLRSALPLCSRTVAKKQQPATRAGCGKLEGDDSTVRAGPESLRTRRHGTRARARGVREQRIARPPHATLGVRPSPRSPLLASNTSNEHLMKQHGIWPRRFALPQRTEVPLPPPRRALLQPGHSPQLRLGAQPDPIT